MILVDAHVHIYDCFDLENFFDSAYSNFKNEAIRSDYGADFIGILMLAETVRETWFNHLYSFAGGGNSSGKRHAGDWRFYCTDEPCSLHARSGDKRELLIIAGRQFVTLEGLEVLSLASTNSFPEDLPIRQLLSKVQNTGGTPVIPWGFGKWMGQRGKILGALIKTAEPGDFHIGDNGGRPSFMSASEHFRLAKQKGIRILPGSDPLPFESEQKRVGSFGFSLELEVDKKYPAQYVKETLFSKASLFYPYGSMEKNMRFITKQIRMQLRKRVHYFFSK